MHDPCTHADAIQLVDAPLEVCEACVEIGGAWVHLRQCLTCGRTLCCNDSSNRHMTGHYEEIGHPIMRGASPGEQWTWCFIDEAMVRAAPAGWETYDPFIDSGTVVAKQHLEEGGTADPAEDLVLPSGFPLGDWFAYVRELRRDGDLDPADAAEFHEAGETGMTGAGVVAGDGEVCGTLLDQSVDQCVGLPDRTEAGKEDR